MGLQSQILVNSSGTLSEAELPDIELFKGYPDGVLKFATACCLIIMLIGIPGNILTIVALARYKKVRNATVIFIINLSCSDLLFCFHIPLAASIFQHRTWIYGQIICQISLFTKNIVFVNSFLSVLAISINRYIMVAHPNSYSKIYKKRNIIIMLVCLWIISIGSITPIVVKVNGGSNINNASCSNLSLDPSRYLKKIIFVIVFSLLGTAIIIFYARIFCIVRKATKRTNTLLKTAKRLPNPEESSAAVLSTSVSVRVTDVTSYNYMSKQLHNYKISSINTNIIVQSTKMEMSDKIIKQTENMEEDPPGLHRTTLNKSIKFLKMSVPTRKDRHLGGIIIAIILSFCFCHLPILILKVVSEKNMQPKLVIAAHIMFFLSFSINPIIYVVISNEYRKAYKNLFKP